MLAGPDAEKYIKEILDVLLNPSKPTLLEEKPNTLEAGRESSIIDT